MGMSTIELAKAKDAVAAILEGLGLSAYLFEVEPRDGRWELRMDCATAEGWQSLQLQVEKDRLLAAATDPAVREELARAWRGQLGACKTDAP